MARVVRVVAAVLALSVIGAAPAAAGCDDLPSDGPQFACWLGTLPATR